MFVALFRYASKAVDLLELSLKAASTNRSASRSNHSPKGTNTKFYFSVSLQSFFLHQCLKNRHAFTTGQPKLNCGHFKSIIQLNHIMGGTTMGEHRCERITPSLCMANFPQRSVFAQSGGRTRIIILYEQVLLKMSANELCI